MGSFCVYGRSLYVATQRAIKSVDSTMPDSECGRKLKPVHQYEAEVEAKAASLFQSMKPMKISPEYDFPAPAVEWMNMARRDSKYSDLQVFVWDKCGKDRFGRDKFAFVWWTGNKGTES